MPNTRLSMRHIKEILRLIITKTGTHLFEIFNKECEFTISCLMEVCLLAAIFLRLVKAVTPIQKFSRQNPP